MFEIGCTTILEENSDKCNSGANGSHSEPSLRDSPGVLATGPAPGPEMTMARETGLPEENGALKRKREEEDGKGTVDSELDDPLFVTKKRHRHRTVERVKKVNAVVKEVKKKKEVENAHTNGDREFQEPEGKARGYQLEILREALTRNTIVYLETGCGKTLIAVLRIKSLAHRLRMPAQKRIAVFLVPTVNLVRQQSCVIDCHTDFKVGEYVGHMGVDSWKPEKWYEEIASHEVFVMTPQILLDLLTHGILKLDVVEILVFDECHHATKKHPYCKIMDKYRETPIDSRPQIFGMTASPVNRKGVSSSADADKQLASLEQQLDAKVYAVKDRSELESYVPTPRTLGREYEASRFPKEDYKLKLQEIAEKYQVYNKGVGSTQAHFKDYEEVGKKICKAIKKLNNALVYCLDKLGISCALKAAETLLKEDIRDIPMDPNVDVVAVLKSAKDSFLKESLHFLQSAAPKNVPQDLLEQVNSGLLTPKVKLLADVLVGYRDVQEMRCIVFVDRVVASLVLANLINELKCLSFLRCEYLAGINGSLEHISRKFQQTAIEKFRAGQLNLLVATNVAEEGLDVQGCHSVIRFDPCTSVRSYIQSRGRARRPGSDYIVFLETDNEREKEDFRIIVESELKMTEKAVDRPEGPLGCPTPQTMNQLESFRVESTGAVLTTDSSVNFMYRYCSKLPGDKYYTPKPEFSFTEGPVGMYVCTIRLPPNSTLPEVMGPPRKNQLLAKQAACLEACKQLHAKKAVSDHLLPVVEDEKIDESERMNLGTTKNRGAGTTKRKELHNTITTSAMMGSWGDNELGTSLHAYKLTFSAESDDNNLYRGFTFLVETELDEDVAHLKVDLVLRLGRMATARFYPAGRIDLTPAQLRDAKLYQELLFSGMFGKLLTRSSNVARGLTTHKSLVVATPGELWAKRMYLMLPLNKDTDPGAEAAKSINLQIDWRSITDTAAAFQKFRSIYSDVYPGTPPNLETEVLRNDFAATPCPEPEYLQMALGVRTKLSDVVDTVVLTIHTGMIYVITKVHKKSAKAPFPELKEAGKEFKFANYSDYFAQKHKHLLKYPDQPLLQAKQTHRARNLLARNSVTGKGKKKRKSEAKDAEPSSVEIPPELCVVLGVSSALVRSAYLVPSVMHRLEAALTASALRRAIREELPQCPSIPILRTVEALTTSRCLEEFSLEALELLGDSFLKYAQSRYLFLKFETKHEGQLSARRCREICNAKLHALAMNKGLAGYIRDEVFDPSCWVAPGIYSPKVLLCRCDLANLWESQSQTESLGKDDEKLVRKPMGTKVVKIGKSCANGHRWLCSKTISDVVEALIGAYFVEGGAAGALSFMTWAGFEVEVDEAKIARARTHSAVDLTTVNIGANLQVLESILNYTFTNRALLVEAITHASQLELKGGFCYQRLEFLGDAVLDLLITQHLYFSHPGLTPGHLTDLRSAAVNNECFARVAVTHKLNKYLRHGSGFLLKQIEEFVETYKNSADVMKSSSYGWDGVKGPKVLGDMVESIAGAILIDSGFDLETVWKSMKPLLSPIVTPETLPLHPVRELQELCHLRDFGMVLQVIQDEKILTVRIFVDLGVTPKLSAASSLPPKRTAQKDAAQQMLALLEARGIWHPCKVPSLGESCLRPTAPTENEGHGLEAGGRKRKLDELQQGEESVAITDHCPDGVSVDKKTRPLYTTLHEAISLITGGTEDGTVVSHDNTMISCGSAALMSTEHKKRELDCETLVVEVPA